METVADGEEGDAGSDYISLKTAGCDIFIFSTSFKCNGSPMVSAKGFEPLNHILI